MRQLFMLTIIFREHTCELLVNTFRVCEKEFLAPEAFATICTRVLLDSCALFSNFISSEKVSPVLCPVFF